MSHCQSLSKRLLLGAAAGAAGTLVLQGVVIAVQRFAPDWDAPEHEDPASFMLWQVEKHLPPKTWMAIPAKAETAAGIALSLGYGSAAGALYAALRGSSSHTLAEGLAFGTAVWAIGYLGWLPAARLMPPLWKQDMKQITGPLVTHAIYGLITVAAYAYLDGKW